jgi:hypothetical protein
MATQKLRCVWHWRTPQFVGSHIVDLYKLKMLKPELFTSASGKYETTSVRKMLLMNNPIPPLDCLWNAAIHTSTVHPQIVHDAKRAAGLPVQPTEYFEIPVDKLREFPVCIYHLPPPALVMKLRIVWNALMYKLGWKRLLMHTSYEPFNFDHWQSLEEMPADTMKCYRAWAEEMRAGPQTARQEDQVESTHPSNFLTHLSRTRRKITSGADLPIRTPRLRQGCHPSRWAEDHQVRVAAAYVHVGTRRGRL